MNKKTLKIILIIVAAIIVLFVIGFLLLRPAKQAGQKNTLQNLFPFGQPKENQQNQTGSGLASPDAQQTTGNEETTTETGTNTTGGGNSTTSGGTTGSGTTAPVIETGTGAQTPNTSVDATPTPTTGTETSTPDTGIPQAPTPSVGSGLGSLTATAAPLLQNKPVGINCDSSSGNTCFNKIEAAIYFGKAELAEVDQVIAMLRGDASNEGIATRLMNLDQCIPGPDYGYERRMKDLLDNNDEWKQIGSNGQSVFDIRKKAGINLELNDVINNIRTEMAFRSKNIPMAADGLAYINATPKYNEVLRQYRDKRTELARTIASLENLNTAWKTAKATNSSADQQQVTTMFANLGSGTPTQDAWYEAFNTKQKISQDITNIKKLQDTCGTQRTQYATSFATQKTYIGSKVQQQLRNIVDADNSKRLYCPIDKYHVNNISREISGTLLYQIAVNDHTVQDDPESGVGWSGLNLGDAGSNMDYQPLNTQNVWLDGTVFYPIDQIVLQAETLRSILQRHNPEMGYIGTVQDQEHDVGGQSYFDDPNFVNDVLVDDHMTTPETGLRRHSLYSFGISCEAIYKSSRYDYQDELTLYGY